MLISVLINIPKFFESYVYYNEDRQMYSLGVSEMRRNPLYSMISQWVRLFLLGLIPFTIILYFNIKIYKKLRKRTLLRNSTMSTGKRGKFISDNGKVCIAECWINVLNWKFSKSIRYIFLMYLRQKINHQIWASWAKLIEFLLIDHHFYKKLIMARRTINY